MMKILKTKNKISKSNGFTVLETIVALSIISLAISGAFAAVRQGLYSSSVAKEETRAYFLAQEAVEMIRNKRAANVLDHLINGSSATWLTGIAESAGDPCYFGKTCKLDSTGPGGVFFSFCGNSWGTCPVLQQDSSTYLYNYSGSITTPYKREIQLENINSNEVAVIVQISWTHGSLNRSFKIKTILTNWF